MAKTIALRSYSSTFSFILRTRYASVPTSDSISSDYNASFNLLNPFALIFRFFVLILAYLYIFYLKYIIFFTVHNHQIPFSKTYYLNYGLLLD